MPATNVKTCEKRIVLVPSPRVERASCHRGNAAARISTGRRKGQTRASEEVSLTG